ncbi:hypothetical protein [Rhodococcus pyridinivorans]
MTDSYLPDARRGGQVSSYSDSRPALPFSAAKRLEKKTARVADEIAAKTYLKLLETESKTAIEVADARRETLVAQTKVAGALALENDGLIGTAALGNRVSAELEHASPLAQKMTSEILVGSSGRITRALESGMRRIENA